MNCPKCNAAIPAGKNFCVECGEHLPEQMQIRKCTKCGAVIPEGKNFCIECGERLPDEKMPAKQEPRKCAKCGAIIPEGKNFCVECGEFLTSSTTAAQNTPPAGKLNFWQKIFQKRLARKDYWLLCLSQVVLFGFVEIIGFVIAAAKWPVAGIIFSVLLEFVFSLLFLFLEIERLHDADKSGWNVCWFFLPIIGYVILLIQLCLPGTDGSNRFGNPPQRIF